MTPRNWWNVENFEDDTRWANLTLFLKDVYNILLKGITPQDNFKGALLEVTFTSANVDLEIRHGLQFTPSNYHVYGISEAMSIYDGVEDPNSKFFYLRSSATGTARIFIF